MKPVLTMLAVAAAVLVGGELAARIEDRIRWDTPFLSPYRSQDDLLIRDAAGMHGRPDAMYQKWHLNGLGMRGPAADSLPAAGTVRVVIAGASEAFGVYESPDQEFPRQVEDSLRAWTACRPGAPAFEVLNAAFRGMSLPTVTQDLRLRVARYAPAIVVYYPTPGQYLEVRVPTPAARDSSAGAGALPPGRAWSSRFLARVGDQVRRAPPAALRAWSTERRVERFARSQPEGWRFAEIPADRLAAFDADLRALVATVRATGAVPVLATHANAFPPGAPPRRDYLAAWGRVYPRATAGTIVAFAAAANEAVARVAADSGVALAPVAAGLHAVGDRVFGDFAHFTDTGAGIVAGIVARSVWTAHGLDRPGCASQD